MVKLISEGIRGNVVALAASGKVDRDDYERVIIPAIEEKLRAYGKIRLFYDLTPDFTGYSPGALWDDTQVGLRHWTAFEKIAVVTDLAWVGDAVKFFGFFVPCPVRIFRQGNAPEALAWVNE